MVIWVDCHIRTNVVVGGAKIIERGKRIKRNAGTSVAKLTGGLTEMDCKHDMWADLENLRLETDAKYCARNRTNVKGYKNIAKTCYLCGITV